MPALPQSARRPVAPLPRTYAPAPAYGETPVRRRLSGLGLALGINLLILLALLTLGVKPLPLGGPGAITINFVPQADDEDKADSKPSPTPPRPQQPEPDKPPVRPIEPPKIQLPSRVEQPWIEISKEEMAAGDVRNL